MALMICNICGSESESLIAGGAVFVDGCRRCAEIREAVAEAWGEGP